jgi:phage tail sheath gpL-like
MRKLGVGIKLWLVPLAAPGGGTANTRTLTVTGTATANGDLVIRIAGRTIRVPVKSGDVLGTVATSIKAAADQYLSDLPYTFGVSSGVVTATATHAGVNHNAAIVEVVSSVAGTSVAAAVGVAGAGVSSIVTALDNLGARDYLGIALGNHLSQDLTDLGTHLDAMWAASKKRYRHAFLGETGTLGTATTLAAAANRKDILIEAMEASPSLPGEIAAACAVMAQSKDRPSYNYDGTELPLYAPADASVFDDAEIESALSGGVTPLSVTDGGGVRVERLVTTKTLVSSIRFENLLDYANSATVAYYARQLDARLSRAIQGQNVDEDFLKDLRDIAYDVLKQGEALGDLHHVDDHAAEIVVAAHPSIPSRVLLEFPQSVVPNAHQIDVTHRMFIEGA